MAWIVIRGHGTWRDSGSAERQPDGGWSRPTTYEAGKHEVSDDVAARAHEAGHLVFAEEPAVIDADTEGTEADRAYRRRFKDGGIQIATAADVEAVDVNAGNEVRSAYPCPLCPVSAPSQPALGRHMALHHGPAVQSS